MPVYFGIPLTCNEAFRIFGLDFEIIKQQLMVKNNWKREFIHDYYFRDGINDYFIKMSKKIRLYSTDKGQCIVGYIIEEPSDVWEKFINVDEFMTLLIKLKSQFAEEILDLKADLSEVTLEYMEGEPEIVRYPAPYIISYNE
jgi:hypothetical protein